MRIYQFLLVLVFPLLSCVKSIEMKSQPIKGGFQLFISSDVEVLTESPVEDFFLYNFRTQEGKEFLTLYIGNHPLSTSDIPKSAVSLSNVISGYPSNFVKWSDEDGLFNGDVYIELLKSNWWPETAHFTYRKATPAQQLKIEKIILSFSKTKGP